MDFRRLVNVAAAELMKGMDEKSRERVFALLREPFDYELTKEQAARAERRRMAMEIGAYDGQAGLIAAFGLKPK